MPSDNESFFDPTDLAMFAGARASVPLMSMLYSKEANAGPAYERFAQQRAYEQMIADRRRDEQARRAMALREQQELDARVPPEVQRWYINSRYDPDTATRRADYAQPQRRFGSPGSEMRAAPRRFQKGGKVVKTVRQMADELMVANAGARTVLPAAEREANLAKMLKGSAVKDRMYHGTIADFGAFDNTKTGANDSGLWGRGHYFSSSTDNANSYAMRQGDNARVIPAYLSIKNPLVLKTGDDLVTRLPDGTDYKKFVGNNLDGSKIKKMALDAGHDGVVQIRPNGSVGDAVAYESTQIKSAIGNRGTYDLNDPDITKAEGGSVHRYQKGGSARKTIQQMADELMAKGVKTAAKDAPDIGRRALFGLRPQRDMPLAKLHPDIEKAAESQLSKAMKGAPQETTKSVEVNPATGSIKSTLQSVAGTPISRRAVLSSAVGQTLRGLIPGLDDLAPGVGDIAKVADTVADVAAPAAMTTDMIPGFMLSVMKAGASKDDALKMVMGKFKLQRPIADRDRFLPTSESPIIDPVTGKPTEKDFMLDMLYDTLGDPSIASDNKYFIEPLRPTEALKDLLSPSYIDYDTPPMKLRGALRSMKEADPDRYRGLIEHARDYSMSTGETAVENGMMTPRNLERYMKGVDAEPKYRPERYWNE